MTYLGGCFETLIVTHVIYEFKGKLLLSECHTILIFLVHIFGLRPFLDLCFLGFFGLHPLFFYRKSFCTKLSICRELFLHL